MMSGIAKNNNKMTTQTYVSPAPRPLLVKVLGVTDISRGFVDVLLAVQACHLQRAGGLLRLLVLSDTQEAGETQGDPFLWIHLIKITTNK